jgi:hypothetical protein
MIPETNAIEIIIVACVIYVLFRYVGTPNW